MHYNWKEHTGLHLHQHFLLKVVRVSLIAIERHLMRIAMSTLLMTSMVATFLLRISL